MNKAVFKSLSGMDFAGNLRALQDNFQGVTAQTAFKMATAVSPAFALLHKQNGIMATLSPAHTAAKLAAALNPAAGIHAAFRAMQPCLGLDLRSPAERVFSHIMEDRAAWGRAFAALRKRGKGNANKEQSPDYAGNISHIQGVQA
ncbi:hypothetical protein FACS189479_04990 [Spirochaetia bacterium]|nr:hypothetical protein FACS189479_04990 [Spirochaetia bacterium]